MKHLKILVQVPFATSKVILDIQSKKHCIRVALRVAERLKTQEIRKYCEYHKNGRKQSLVPSLPSANKNLVLVIKNYAKTDFKVFLSCPILFDFLTLFHEFCPRLQGLGADAVLIKLGRNRLYETSQNLKVSILDMPACHHCWLMSRKTFFIFVIAFMLAITVF